MGDVVPMYPKGVPPAAAKRLVAVYGNKELSQIEVPNIFTGSETTLEKEREFLHVTVDNAIAALYSMSPNEKHNTFVSFGNLLKQVYDMYCKEKMKGKL